MGNRKELSAAIKKALQYLNEPESLLRSPLLTLPAVVNREFCKLEGCTHNHSYNCLALTITNLIETRIRNWQNPDNVWRGCVLLEIYRVFPVVAQSTTNIEIEDLVKFNSNTQMSSDVARAGIYIEHNLLDGHSILSLFKKWPAVSKLHILMRLARHWLLDQLQNISNDFISLTRELLKNQYSKFTTINVETIEFADWPITPLLRLRGSENEVYTIEEILKNFPGENIYIYGPAGFGKSVLYRYTIWLLNSRYENLSNQFPVPLDCEQFGRNIYLSSDDLITLAIEQLQPYANGFLMEQLPRLLKATRTNLRVIIDNLDSLSFNQSPSLWHSILAQELKDLRFIIFSRRREPWPQYGRTKMRICDIIGFSGEQIRRFISEWAIRHKQADQYYKWQAAVEQTASSMIKLAKIPIGLTAICLKLEQSQELRGLSIIDLKQIVVEMLLSSEAKRLLPTDDTGTWQMANLLSQLAWHVYINPESGTARNRVYNLTREAAERLFDDGDAARQLLMKLCRSRFLSLEKKSYSGEEIITFPENISREYFMARQLSILGPRGQRVLEQVSDRDDWKEVIMFYNQFLLTEVENE